VLELMGYLGDADPRAPVQAHPGQGTHVPLWILGSSLYGAQLAAHFGLPYAFASHFAPDALEDAAFIYRRDFKPSASLAQPKFMLAVNVIGAPTDAEAAHLRTSVQQAFARLRSGMPGKLPAPVDDIDAEIGPALRRGVDSALRINATGSPATVRAQLAALVAKYQPDELILTGQIHNHAARKRSFAIAAEALQDVAVAA
jgi:luciferase family oxidoreductase group 1